MHELSNGILPRRKSKSDDEESVSMFYVFARVDFCRQKSLSPNFFGAPPENVQKLAIHATKEEPNCQQLYLAKTKYLPTGVH